MREDLINCYENGRELLEELDKFTSLARQVFIDERKEQEKADEAVRREEMERMVDEQQMEEDGEEEDEGIKTAVEHEEEEEEEEETEVSDDTGHQRKHALAAISPKSLPITVEDEAKQKAERRLERANKRLLGSRLVRELREQFDDRPDEIHDQPLFGAWLWPVFLNPYYFHPNSNTVPADGPSRQEEARRRYEEANFVRLGMSRVERKAHRQRIHLGGGNQLERELLSFGHFRGLPESSQGWADAP
jgi:U3 small nucleolar ribonucleoprotein protein LCP5